MSKTIIRKIKDTDSVKNITLNDYARISYKNSSLPCQASVGDIIEIEVKNQKTMGILTEILDDKMCIIAKNGTKQWWTKYVKYQIICYNK
jgi:DNA-binding Xre family transcriptional regulator